MVTEVKTGSLEEKQLIEKTKKLSVKEACAYSFMDGFGLRYVTPYALAVGANNTQIGLLSSVPGLLGNMSQLFSIHAIKRWKRKKAIFWGVFLQALMWLLLLAASIPFFFWGIKTDFSPNAIIVIYTLLILVGAFAGPPWTSMMRDLIPASSRGDYFGRRNRIAGVVSLVCLFVAGFILDYFRQTHIFIGFAILFIIAAFGRLTSSILITKHYDPKFEVDDKKYFTLLDFIKKMRNNNFGRFVLYFSLISFACAIASPFFVVYYFKNLGFSYTQYMITVVANSIATILLMPLWGKFADKYGNLKVMQITGFLVPLIPLLYIATSLVHTSLVLLMIVPIEICSGIIWAGFNLAAGNFIYDAVSRERLAICSSYFSVINGFFALLGAVIGGYLSSNNISMFGLDPLIFLFLLSGLLRIIVHQAMSKKINEVRSVDGFDLHKHIIRHTKIIFEHTKRITKNIMSSVSLDRFFEAMVSESEHNYSSNPNNLLKNH